VDESGGVVRDKMMEKKVYGEAKGSNNGEIPALENGGGDEAMQPLP
jgi:hypothetical protein